MVEAEGSMAGGRQEDKEREFVLRFRMPKLVPEETRVHLRAAQKELLLAFRSVIDNAIERMDERQQDKGTRTTRIEVK